MIIGLYDADMAKYTYTCFNLELMKIAAYYKKRREIVILSPLFTPNKFTKIFYRKDYYDGIFEKELHNFNNVEYGGYAFGEKYLPLLKDIEQMRPDSSIYENFRKKYCNNSQHLKNFTSLTRGEHFRLSQDGIHIWNDFEKQILMQNSTRIIINHDYNLNQIIDSDIAIKEIISHSQRKNNEVSLGNKFPIQVSTYKELNKWLQIPAAFSLFLLQYNGIIEDEYFYELVETKLNTHLSQFNYNVCIDDFNEKEFIQYKLPQLFYQMIYNKMNRGRIQISYNEASFKNKELATVLRLFNAYSISTLKLEEKQFQRGLKYDSLYSYASHLKEKRFNYKGRISKEDAREAFKFIQENNYELFKQFYEVHTVNLKGGEFQPC